MITRNYKFLVVFLSLVLTACFNSGGGGGGNKAPILDPIVGPFTAVENTTTLITTATASDIDAGDTLTFSLAGDDASNFTIDGVTGAITFIAPDYDIAQDFDGNNIYDIRVIVTDASGAADSQNISVSLTNVTLWSWVSGSDTVDQSGVYGSLNTADPANIPGARNGAVSWIDESDNLWLFGGYGLDSNGNLGRLNDLWKWDGTNWTWISGSEIRNQNGTYGTASDVPGGRQAAVSWIDNTSGNLWLFGGYGYDSGGALGRLNDVWKWDGSIWTWVSGSDMANQAGSYGTQGTAEAANVPGGRQAAVSWIDNTSGNLWLFGGYGYDSAGTPLSQLNDLWRWDGTNWTWISGSNTVDGAGTYGMQGTANASNLPGARFAATTWTDTSGNVWLFGGQGVDGGGLLGRLNDLWRWNGTNWTWISGSDTVNQAGSYGTQGTSDAANVPGARSYSVGWIDSSDNLWLFGGIGIDSNGGTASQLNGLWRYRP